MKTYKKIVCSEKDWLEIKSKTIGGSECAAVIDKSKWVTKDSLFNKLVYGQKVSISVNDKMIAGAKAENHIKELFYLDNQGIYKEVKLPKTKKCIFIRKDKEYISCTPDSLAKSVNDNSLYGLEIKYVDLRNRQAIEMWANNELPIQYLSQCLQYLIVFKEMKGVCLYAHLKHYKQVGDTEEWKVDYSEQRQYWLYRSDENVAKQVAYLEEKETEFMEKYVSKQIRPKAIIKLS